MHWRFFVAAGFYTPACVVKGSPRMNPSHFFASWRSQLPRYMGTPSSPLILMCSATLNLRMSFQLLQWLLSSSSSSLLSHHPPMSCSWSSHPWLMSSSSLSNHPPVPCQLSHPLMSSSSLSHHSPIPSLLWSHPLLMSSSFIVTASSEFTADTILHFSQVITIPNLTFPFSIDIIHTLQETFLHHGSQFSFLNAKCTTTACMKAPGSLGHQINCCNDFGGITQMYSLKKL